MLPGCFQIFNFGFVIYYVLEQTVKVWAAGCRRYIHEKSNIFDGVITFLLAVCVKTNFYIFSCILFNDYLLNSYLNQSKLFIIALLKY